MTLTIELKPEVETKLKTLASAEGCELSEYITKLIEEDSNKLRTLDEIFTPFRESIEKSNVSENELDEIFTKARREVFAEKKAKQE